MTKNLITNNIKEPKVLVISNNPFDGSKNNGKTLASFFENFHLHNIAQLYFSTEIPANTPFENFFQISDQHIIQSLLNKGAVCGKVLHSSNTTGAGDARPSAALPKGLKRYNALRLAREILWKLARWESKELKRWLDEFSPDVIFFCAGDSAFAYDVASWISEKYDTKLVVYITDDYVLPRKTLNALWWIRRNITYSKMKTAIHYSDHFYTISNKMREIYKTLFGKDSTVLVNMTPSMREEGGRTVDSDVFTLLYAGGLHSNRHKSLKILANCIEHYNRKPHKKKAYLKIYSNTEPNRSLLEEINLPGASQFCGFLQPDELKSALNACDIAVHVESFDRRSIESTRLSVSTKISEYLSLAKPVLAIGPAEIASMEYLKDVAFCVTDPSRLYEDIARLIEDKQLQADIASRTLGRYELNHNKEVLAFKFKAILVEVCSTQDDPKK